MAGVLPSGCRLEGLALDGKEWPLPASLERFPVALPAEPGEHLLQELELYDPALLERPRLVGANKMDEAVAEANLKKFKRRIRRTPVLPIAAAFDQGIERFKKTIREAVTASMPEASSR